MQVQPDASKMEVQDPNAQLHCIVCTNFFGSRHVPKQLGCGHSYCLLCLYTALQTSKRVACPLDGWFMSFPNADGISALQTNYKLMSNVLWELSMENLGDAEDYVRQHAPLTQNAAMPPSHSIPSSTNSRQPYDDEPFPEPPPPYPATPPTEMPSTDKAWRDSSCLVKQQQTTDQLPEKPPSYNVHTSPPERKTTTQHGKKSFESPEVSAKLPRPLSTIHEEPTKLSVKQLAESLVNRQQTHVTMNPVIGRRLPGLPESPVSSRPDSTMSTSTSGSSSPSTPLNDFQKLVVGDKTADVSQSALLDASQSSSADSMDDGREKLTILLLGETGCGKSTCVNAIANYIRYENIDEALKGDLVSFIPTKFHVTDENFQQKIIQVGESENECFDTGKSATQQPQVYNFITDKYNVDLVDTPGIGDVAGLEQDKKNMNAILSTLSDYKTINAVCLMMKSNDARLTLNLSYCLSELFLRLHKDAVHNVCFIFTNSRGTFYRPGDSLPTLQTFLARLEKDKQIGAKMGKIVVPTTRDNTFCLDNEAYRLACAAHQGVTFASGQKQAFAESWTHSSQEIFRLLDYAATRSPHEVALTLNLNQARKVILNMAKPMADITQMNQDNMNLARRHMIEVQNTKAELYDLREKLKIPQESFVVEPLQYPVTVCNGPNCVETRSVANTGALQIVHTTICHSHCFLLKVTKDRHPEPELKNCKAMDKHGICKTCGCNWQAHMHIYYRQTKTMELVDDPIIVQAIARNTDAVAVKQQMLDQVNSHIKELEEEQRIIRKCSAYFASFLKESAIIPYNDIFEDHAKRIIEEERRLAAQSGDSTTLEALEQALIEYREERKTIEEALKNTKENFEKVHSEDINEKLEELFALKHTGRQLSTLFQQISRGDSIRRSRKVVMSSRWKRLTLRRAQESPIANGSASGRSIEPSQPPRPPSHYQLPSSGRPQVRSIYEVPQKRQPSMLSAALFGFFR